jgi:aminoacyl tRNA synthase complex-interacting multifunctional protein 1
MSSPRVTCDASSPAGQTIALLCKYKNISSDVIVDSKTNPSTPPRYHRDSDDKSSSFEGLVPVAKALCGDENDDASSLRLLGATDAEKLAIDDWLAAVNTTYSGVEFDADCEQALESLNEHLKTKSHVAANDRATLADIVLFGAVREKVKQMMASGQLKQKKSLVRWCKRMQSVLSVGEEDGAIDFSAMDATWTALPRSESGGKAQVSTSGTKKESGEEKAQQQQQQQQHPQGGSQPLDDPVAEAKRLKAIAKKEAKAAEKAAAKAARKAAAEAEGGLGGGDAAAAGATAAAEKEVDVSVVDIRVGKIVKAWEHPEADKLWAEEIDVGLEKPLQVCSGLREFKTLEDMTNADVLVICNMKPNKMRGLNSEAMVLCASNEDHTKVDFVKPPSGAKIGERVTFEGFEGEPEKVLNPKKKQLDKVLPKLKTDADGVACYDGKKAMTSAGACTSSLKDCFIK